MDWNRIPKGSMVTVSRRKFMRLRYMAKLWANAEPDFKAKLAEAENKATLAWKQAEIYQHQHLTTMDRAAEWMDRALKAETDLAHALLSQKELV